MKIRNNDGTYSFNEGDVKRVTIKKTYSGQWLVKIEYNESAKHSVESISNLRLTRFGDELIIED